jgi:hypothetical protein
MPTSELLFADKFYFIFSTALLALFGYCIYALRLSAANHGLKVAFNQYFLLQIVAYLGCALVVYRFSVSELFIPYWDYAGYWRGTSYFTELIYTDHKKAFEYLLLSIENDEYNAIPCLMLAPMLQFLGSSYSDYILSVFLAFAGPFLIGFNLLCFHILSKIDGMQKMLNSILWQISITILTFTLPVVFAPVMMGYLDAVGLLLVLPLVYFTYNKSLLSGVKPFKIFIFAVCIIVLAISRRWYVILIVGLALASVVLIILEAALFNRAQARKMLLSGAINYGIVFTVFFLVPYWFFPQYFQRTYLKQYEDIYSAYRYGAFWDDIKITVLHYGIWYWLIVLAGLVYLVLNKATRTFGIFIFLLVAITFYIFNRINSFGLHHHNVIVLPVMLLAAFGSTLLIMKSKWMAFPLVALSVLNAYAVFYSNGVNTPYYSAVLSELRAAKKIRTDYVALKNLIQYLNELSDGGKKKIYCLASSHVLNDDILRNYTYLREGNAAIPGLIEAKYHAHVDKRDPFPIMFFDADIICVADPIQYHLGEENQHVVGYLARKLLYDTLWQQKYKLINTVQLAYGVKAKIFKKVGYFNNNDLEDIESFFETIYPNFKSSYDLTKYATDIIRFRLHSISNGDNYGHVEYYANLGLLSIHPGANKPSSFQLTVNKEFDQFMFVARLAETERLIAENNNENGEVFLYVYGDGQLIEKRYLNWHNQELFSIDISKYNELKIEVDKGKYEDFVDRVELLDFVFKRL